MRKVLGHIWRELAYTLALAIAVWLCSDMANIAVNFTPIGVLGSALAIFVAFRNNASYGRWWEARQLWGGIVNSSRVFARLVITFTDSHNHQPNYDKDRSERFKREMVYLQIAWANALRLHLRKQPIADEIKPFLPQNSSAGAFQNTPNMLQLLMGRKIYEAMANGTLGGFDSFQMEGQLLALANYQGGCERIKNTPMPKQYDFFTRLFIWVFATLLPFGLLSLFKDMPWAIVPLSGIIASVFAIMEKTGALNEDPFENKTTDVAMSAICNTIERDLKEMLNEPVPPKMEAVDGYLF